MGNRLCTSLTPDFDIDAVFLNPGDAAAVEFLAQNARKNIPWIRNLFIIQENRDVTAPLPGVFFIPAQELLTKEDADMGTPPEALLHTLPDLSENYLVFASAQLPERTPHPLDYYTPNGIPLIPCSLLADGIQEIMEDPDPLEALQKRLNIQPRLPRKKDILSPYAQTRDNSLNFYSFYRDLGKTGQNLPDNSYRNLLRQWLYLSGRGIPTPGV